MRKRKKSEDSGFNVWRSYSDMMAGVLLLFVLIMCVTLFQAQKSYQDSLKERDEKIALQEKYTEELLEKQNALDEQAGTLKSQDEQIKSKDEQIKSQDKELTSLAEKLEEQQKTLEEQQKKLTEQEKKLEINPIRHKEYLYHFFEGTYPYSFARGELYNYDPATKDARSCGTTASLCGIEKGGFEGDLEQVKQGIQRVLMMSMEGFVMLSSGDEIGQVNDYDYKKNPDIAADSRYLHRSPFQWDNADKRKKAGTVQYDIWNGLKQMEEIRRQENCFGETAGISTWDTGNYAVFAIRRTAGNEELICLANFSEYGQNAWLNCLEGEYEDLFTGEKLEINSVWMNPYQYRWCVKK